MNTMNLQFRYRQASWFQLNFNLKAFYGIYWLLGREAELKRLVVWAERKRLTKPRTAYQNRLIEAQTALTRIRVRSPQMWHVARFCFHFADWLFPAPTYMQKGSAASYRKR